MKTVKNFSKGFVPCAIISIAIILFGAAGLFTKGINFGIDFVPGLLEEVKITASAEGNAENISSDDVRSAITEFSVSVKELESDGVKSFQIRAKANSNDDTNVALKNSILTALTQKFGENSVEILKEDFVGSSFSSSLAVKSIMLAVVTLLLIWVYATIRFHWDFALGAIVALVHDCMIMFTFISWSQIEFSTTTLAAVLTIFGYSINATVVILDRVRGNLRFAKTNDFKEILNKSITDTLNRSIITTVTTLFASISLLVFTTGSIRDFAVVLTVGLISGCYSSMFISSGVISFIRRNWKSEYQGHVHMPKVKKSVEIQLDD